MRNTDYAWFIYQKGRRLMAVQMVELSWDLLTVVLTVVQKVVMRAYEKDVWMAVMSVVQ